MIDQRREIAVTLGDGGLDDAVVERPTVAVVGEGDRRIDGRLATFGSTWVAGCALAPDDRRTARARNVEPKRSLAFVMTQPFRTTRAALD